MSEKISVRLTDKMVLIGLAMGAAYWVIETVLCVFMGYKIGFFERLLGPDLNGLSTRIVVICLFLIFGSHSQFTMKQRDQARTESDELREANAELRRELERLRNKIGS